MLEVSVVRFVTRPEYQVFNQNVRILSASKLTPKTARRAIEIAFGSGGGFVYGNGYGYHVHPNSVTKIYPDQY